MIKQECLLKIEKLTKEIECFPKGYISKKEIGGKIYYYLQWSEKGRKKSCYLKNEELPILLEQLEKRKALQEELKSVKEELARSSIFKNNDVAHINCTLMHKNTPVVCL